MPDNWPEKPINSLNSQKEIHFEHLIWEADRKCSWFFFCQANPPPQKTYKTLPLLLSHHRQWRSVSSFYENLWLWPEKLPRGRNESEKEHAHPADNDKRGEVNQVNAKTLNRTNHSALPVHLFTVPTDLILSHAYAGQGKRPRHRADSTQHVQICETNRFRSNRLPFLFNCF